MPNYAVQMRRTASTTASVGSVAANPTTPKRGKLFRLVFGSEGTPADSAFLIQVQRCTAPGTSTPVTPQTLDPSDGAASLAAGENHTVEPTYTANAFLLSIDLHQRATAFFVAAPGKELIFPATANNGLGIKTPTGPAVAVSASVHVEE